VLVVVQNDPAVPPGLLLDLVYEKEISFRLIQLFSEDHSCDLMEARGVIVLGGTMSVQDTVDYPFLLPLKKWIEEVVRREIPFLGICLGGQLLAEVLGGRVRLQERGEKGCQEISLTDVGTTDPLFSGVPKSFVSFQWHNDSFDPPPDALHLARSDTCPYQAFRCGKAAYGIQFHPEVTPEIAFDWSSETIQEQMKVLDAFKATEEAYQSASLTLLGNFLGMIWMQ
jgi:GMP synthase (glutamine-hydrolysing)